MDENTPIDQVSGDSEGTKPESNIPQEENEVIAMVRTLYLNFLENKKLVKTLVATAYVLISVTAFLLAFIFVIYGVPALQNSRSDKRTEITNADSLKKDAAYKKLMTQLNRDVQRLSKKYAGYTSGQSYVVINTTDNRFRLYRNKKLIREGFCSSGSYKMLKTVEGRTWTFKTPKGKFTIQGKITNPTWRRPDWAFVEEGLPIPSADDPSRYEYGVLGDYALALGDGYLIHGTLYKRFLGMPVTHGCVRLNDDDLKAIYNALSIGSKVYIF